jgi:hypothetical protein
MKDKDIAKILTDAGNKDAMTEEAEHVIFVGEYPNSPWNGPFYNLKK